VEYLNHVKLVAAVEDADGKTHFLDDLHPLEIFNPGQSETMKFWRFEGEGASLPTAVGAPPVANAFTGPGGAMFAVICFPPHSVAMTTEQMKKSNPSINYDDGDDPEMHSTDTVDLGFIVSGRTDLRLPNGEIRTLTAGTAFVIAGAGHAWANPYDEPCIFSNVGVGVRRA
jgi:hypothetical protein